MERQSDRNADIKDSATNGRVNAKDIDLGDAK
jgi:hypothetical protein